jgi:hypothetical protein
MPKFLGIREQAKELQPLMRSSSIAGSSRFSRISAHVLAEYGRLRFFRNRLTTPRVVYFSRSSK